MAHFIELCGGSAAVTMFLHDQEPVLSYAGSKRSYAVNLVRLMKLDVNAPESFHINEPGIWYDIHYGLQTAHKQVASVIDHQSDPKSVYIKACLSLQSDDKDIIGRAAASVLKLAGTFGNHEVGGFKGCNPLRQKDGFSPNRKTIISRLINYRPLLNLTLSRDDARAIPPYIKPGKRTVCYMDVPYLGKEKSYVNRFSRDHIIQTALAWKAHGADVYISEASPIEPLIQLGWKTFKVDSSAHTNYRVRRNATEEWLTCFEHHI